MRHEELLARTDWSAVEHAHSGMPEVPRTPEILAALLSDDAVRQARALGDLYGIIHHQDTIYSATAPAVDFVVAVLDAPRMLTPVAARGGVGTVPMRAALLDWLTSVMDAVAASGEAVSGEATDIDACRAARPRVFRAAWAMREDPDPAIVRAALGTLACVLDDGSELKRHRPEVAAWMGEHALARSDRCIRVLAVLTLTSWAYDTSPVLRDDPDAVVRATAALSPAFAVKPEGTRALIDVLSNPADAAWCQQILPYFGRIYPFKLLPVAIDRATLEELVRALGLLLAEPPDGTYVGDWGARLRAKAFPGGFPPPQPLDATQQALLDLVAMHCFGPAAPPRRFAADTRMALRGLVPGGQVSQGAASAEW
ncbi:hypothetical protein [Micromonospora sp. NBC_01796]|uniref:hypothetical protein n=1 Tax=Micromonospora sp. NBC_01796 TaxID=2975987 RepID=UPI002DDA0AA6|nr:hypothetical protein [Micromonospora sp. NBC_01796]WSA83927.1 hypothetical protein OIE47_26645 [Micromonospora sp. NBC_01796]